MQGGNQSSSH